MKDLQVVKTGKQPPVRPHDVAGAVVGLQRRYREARRPLEDTWLECLAMYSGSPQGESYTRNSIARKEDIATDWRHRVNTGKAFQSIEAIHAYLTAAFFPNRNYFKLDPVQHGYAEAARLVTKYLHQKLRRWGFETKYSANVRQAAILGTSVLTLPWRDEAVPHYYKASVRTPVYSSQGDQISERQQWQVTKEDRKHTYQPEYRVDDIFDYFLDPMAQDPNEGNVIREMFKTRAEVKELVEKGFYKNLAVGDVYQLPTDRQESETEWKKTQADRFDQNETDLAKRDKDSIRVLEFWGSLEVKGYYYKNVLITIVGGKLTRFEEIPYWCGKPFVFTTYIPRVNSPYGMGAIEPNLGLLQQLNTVTNQRLDNQELAVDGMYIVKEDGVLDATDIYSRPGKVMKAAETDSIQPVRRDNSWTLTYQETAYLEATIDANFGTGPMVGTSPGRSGERVTAAEIQAQRDAGGNRLSGVHAHMEHTSFLPAVQKSLTLCAQFTDEVETIRVSTGVPGEYNYYEIGPEELQFTYNLIPLGADHVTDTERRLDRIGMFIQMVSGDEALRAQANMDAVMEELVAALGFDNPERFIKPPAPEVPEQEMLPPEAMPMDPSLPPVPPPDPAQHMMPQAIVDETASDPAAAAELLNLNLPN